MDIKFSASLNLNATAIVVGVNEDLKLIGQSLALDKKLGNIISNTIAMGTFKGKKGENLTCSVVVEKKTKFIILVGLGKAQNINEMDLINLGGRIVTLLNHAKIKDAQIIVDIAKAPKDLTADIAFGCLLKNYRFDKYRTKEKKEDKPTLAKLEFLAADEAKAKAKTKELQLLADSIYFTRDLVTEPPNVIYPESMAAKCKELEKLGLKVEVLGEAQMKKLGMGAILGVAQGSIREPKIVVMIWNGAKSSKTPPIAFVGKGVTFDSGGISIKPSAGMEDMKYDMAGSATVVGLMRALASRKAKVNAVGVVGLVENMPSGSAQRPSDVVKSMSGQTIEVLNTDAEGRLVLADALWYCQDRFKPKAMIDLATLTGAVTITFGSIYAGIFSNDDKLAEQILEAGNQVEEKLWRLPIGDAYDKQINSEIADMQNITNERGAGSIIGAQFLKRFVNDVPWAHLDIAGVAWTKKDLDITPKGATAFGVRLLNRLVENHYEG